MSLRFDCWVHVLEMVTRCHNNHIFQIIPLQVRYKLSIRQSWLRSCFTIEYVVKLGVNIADVEPIKMKLCRYIVQTTHIHL